MSKLLTVFSLLLISTSQVYARAIWLAGEHHEAMTLDSMYCAEASEVEPLEFPQRPKKWEARLDLSKINLGVWTQELAEKSVRHPDDPVSELSFGNPVGLIRWSWNMGVVGCKGKQSDITTGLRCSTHYGDFQFMHAMGALEGSEASITKSKIMAWVRYLLLIIQNAPQQNGQSFIEQNYCEYWAGELKVGNPIADVMTPQGQDSFPCVVDKGESWSIASMFAFNCKLDIYTCDVDLSPLNVKSKALGSLLHLIQDSFSQGHALRGDCCDGVSDDDLAAYQCSEIKQFNAYQNHDEGRHTAADKEPFPGESCSEDSDVNDPVTSGAKLLWILKTSSASDESIARLVTYFDKNVFKLVTNPSPSNRGSGF